MLYNYEGKSLKGGVYKIINKINGRIYIGKAARFKERWNKHVSRLRSNQHANKFLQHDWNKCGEKAFEFHIIEIVDGTNAERNALEEKWINEYFDNQQQCYNFKQKSTSLPRSVFSNDPDITKKILSEKAKAMWQDPEIREKILKNRNAAMQTDEYRQACSVAQKKNWQSEERKKQASERLKKQHASGLLDHVVENLKVNQPKGRVTFKKRMKTDVNFKEKFQEQGRNKVAKIQERYKTDEQFRKKMDDHSRKNIIEYNKNKELTRKPTFLSPDGKEYKEIYNLNEFAKKHGLDPSCAYKLINGKLKKHRGWTLVC